MTADEALQEHWMRAIRAECKGVGLIEDGNGNLCVMGLDEEDNVYQLGFVSMTLVLQDPKGARAAIGRIKFPKELPKSEEQSKEGVASK